MLYTIKMILLLIHDSRTIEKEDSFFSSSKKDPKSYSGNPAMLFIYCILPKSHILHLGTILKFPYILIYYCINTLATEAY